MEIPAEVRDIIGRYIDDVEQLEILLLLRRSSERYLSSRSIADELALERADVFSHLEELAGRNLLDVRISDAVLYRFAPFDPKVERVFEQLAAIYANRPIAILNVLAGRSTGAARAFAEAFRIKPKKRRGGGEE